MSRRPIRSLRELLTYLTHDDAAAVTEGLVRWAAQLASLRGYYATHDAQAAEAAATTEAVLASYADSSAECVELFALLNSADRDRCGSFTSVSAVLDTLSCFIDPTLPTHRPAAATGLAHTLVDSHGRRIEHLANAEDPVPVAAGLRALLACARVSRATALELATKYPLGNRHFLAVTDRAFRAVYGRDNNHSSAKDNNNNNDDDNKDDSSSATAASSRQSAEATRLSWLAARGLFADLVLAFLAWRDAALTTHVSFVRGFVTQPLLHAAEDSAAALARFLSGLTSSLLTVSTISLRTRLGPLCTQTVFEALAQLFAVSPAHREAVSAFVATLIDALLTPPVASALHGHSKSDSGSSSGASGSGSGGKAHGGRKRFGASQNATAAAAAASAATGNGGAGGTLTAVHLASEPAVIVTNPTRVSAQTGTAIVGAGTSSTAAAAAGVVFAPRSQRLSLLKLLSTLRAHEDPAQQALVVAALARCPPLVAPYLAAFPYQLEPRTSAKWLAAVALVLRIFSLPVAPDVLLSTEAFFDLAPTGTAGCAPAGAFSAPISAAAAALLGAGGGSAKAAGCLPTPLSLAVPSTLSQTHLHQVRLEHDSRRIYLTVLASSPTFNFRIVVSDDLIFSITGALSIT